MFLDYFDDIIEKNADPRAKQLLLMTTVWQPISIIALYLGYVYYIGPFWHMKNRPPKNIRKLIMGYDILQITLNFYVCYEMIHVLAIRNSWCLPVNFSNDPEALHELNISHHYFLLKILDLMDTFFFVVKKNVRQITFLHIYHHSVMIIFTWLGVKFAGGGFAGYLGFINCIVHCFMYSYYYLTAYNPEYKKSLRLKKTVTQIQLLQFLMVSTIYTFPLFEICDFNKTISFLFTIQSWLFMYLFAMFYYRTYVKIGKDGKII